jgi:hypothetical protein
MPQMHKIFVPDANRFQRPILASQLPLTAVILAWAPGNAIKLAAMLLVWAIGFGRLTRAELVLMACVNAVFVPMDIATLHQGAFRFTAPDLLGLPWYEFLMWGFYVLNAIRFLGAEPQHESIAPAVGLAVLFALPFSLVRDYRLLFPASALALAIGIGFFHKRRDMAFIGYMIAMGAVIEYAGVRSGQWVYRGPTIEGVPLWFATLWGGVGLFIHRLWLPLLQWLGRVGTLDGVKTKRIK